MNGRDRQAERVEEVRASLKVGVYRVPGPLAETRCSQTPSGW
jgi:hypothetical protein